MKKKSLYAIGIVLAVGLSLAGCGDKNVSEQEKAGTVTQDNVDEVNMLDTRDALQLFIDGEIDAERYGQDGTLNISDLDMSGAGWEAYSIGDYIDLDNDGELELILNGPYGGMYLDAVASEVYVFAEGHGNTLVLDHVYFEDAEWIVYCDITHAGRQMYFFEKYEGGNNKVDEFVLSAEYYENENDQYDENSTFTFRNETITMQKYEELIAEIFGKESVEQSEIQQEASEDVIAEIVNMAIEYRERHDLFVPEHVAVYDEGDGKIAIQFYEDIVDDPTTGEGHTATYDWYYINPDTLEGEDLLGEPVNLLQ